MQRAKALKYVRTALAALLSFISVAAACAERNVRIAREWGDICGTLSVPDKDTDTAILFIAGSGPTDRNCNSALQLRTDAFIYLARLADSLGAASLRYDKRGIGASTAAGIDYGALRLDDYVDDAAACAEWLRDHGFAKVILAGHSEGSQIALAAAADRPETAAAVISLSGAARTVDHTLQMQLAGQLAAADPGMLLDAMRIISRLKAGSRVPESEIPGPLRALFRDNVQTFLQSAMEERFDPRRLIRRTTCPVLVIGGEYDLQVPPSEAAELHRARPDTRMVIVERMSHTLKDAASADRLQQMQTVYSNPSLPLSAGLCTAIREFVESLR